MQCVLYSVCTSSGGKMRIEESIVAICMCICHTFCQHYVIVVANRQHVVTQNHGEETLKEKRR